MVNLADGVYTEERDDSFKISRSLVAGAAPMYPPDEWFSNPNLTRPTPLTITSDGRIYGHIAPWLADHIGLPPGTKPPRSQSDYAFFKTGVVKTDSGKMVPAGQLTLAGGHAPLNAGAGEAVKHYDDTSSSVADIAAGEDQHGIWVNGGLRPGVTEEQIRALRASAPSGDWRPINGTLELVAVCQVNTPGFPLARTMVASGEIIALVAAGAAHMYDLQQEEGVMTSLDTIAKRVTNIEQAINDAMFQRMPVEEKAETAATSPDEEEIGETIEDPELDPSEEDFDIEGITDLEEVIEINAEDLSDEQILGIAASGSLDVDVNRASPRKFKGKLKNGKSVFVILNTDDSVNDKTDENKPDASINSGVNAADASLSGQGIMPDAGEGNVKVNTGEDAGPLGGGSMDDDGDYDGDNYSGPTSGDGPANGKDMDDEGEFSGKSSRTRPKKGLVASSADMRSRISELRKGSGGKKVNKKTEEADFPQPKAFPTDKQPGNDSSLDDAAGSAGDDDFIQHVDHLAKKSALRAKMNKTC